MQRITSVTWPVTICDLCCSFVVTCRVHCVTGEVPVGSLGLSKRFRAIIKSLIGVIGRFETARPVLQRCILRSSKSLAASGSCFRSLFEGSVHLFEPS